MRHKEIGGTLAKSGDLSTHVSRANLLRRAVLFKRVTKIVTLKTWRSTFWRS
jgi:hypothetical protein